MPDRFKNLKEIKKEFISIEFFYNECKERFKLKKITANSVNPDLVLTDKDIHRPGLALAGYVDLFSHERVQIFGSTEINYLSQLSKVDRVNALKKYFTFNVPCIIITNNNKPPKELIDLAEINNVPVFRTPYPTTRLSYFISDFLDDQFASQIAIHGSFVDVYGIGILICGESGIGKSEIALDLVERGHRLVADDIVMISKKAESVLIGAGTSLVKHFMEIRGIGIIDVRKIFGIRAIRFQKRVEVIVVLENWDRTKSYERTGLNSSKSNILGLEIETISLPIFPGKNITVIVEVIGLNYLCKHYGYNAAEVFQKKLAEQISKNTKDKGKKSSSFEIKRSIEYFEHDFE